ncbi:MAG: hypothetical protein DRQ35_00530, partial [Gammaproteobacteria bacterium]
TNWINERGNGGLMRGWFNPTINDGGLIGEIPWAIIDGSTDYDNNEYVIAEFDGTYDFATALVDPIGGQVVKRGEVWRYFGGVWVRESDNDSISRGWIDATAVAGGTNLPAQPIDGSIHYNNNDYIICLVNGEFDFTTGEPTVVAGTGVDLDIGDRVRYDGAVWTRVQISPALMRGWFDPDTDGGGTDLLFTEPVIDGGVTFNRGIYVVALIDGEYDFGTGLTAPIGTATNMLKGDRIIYTGTLWVNLGVEVDANRGWFDPAIDGGGTGVPANVVDGDPTLTYRRGDYVISLRTEWYNFRLGITDPTQVEVDTVLVREGDRCVYDGAVWIVSTSTTGLMKGWFDPVSAGGGGLVDDPVVDNSLLYFAREYVIASSQGTYDFGLGAPDPTGVAVERGDRIIFDGTTWTKDQVNRGLMRGWFNPTVADGFGTVPWSIVDTSTQYVIDEYIIAEVDGIFNFATAQPDVAGQEVTSGDTWRFTAAGWVLVASSASGLSRGWLDATIDGGGLNVPAPVVDASVNYEINEYVIVLIAGVYNLALGLTGSGTEFEVGDRIRYDGTVWAKIIPPDRDNTVIDEITQVAHGFTAMQHVYKDNTGSWELARANVAATLKQGFINEVFDADNFEICYYGIVDQAGHGLVVGNTYYLDRLVAGTHVAVVPTADYVQAVFEVLDTNTLKILDQAVLDLTGTGASIAEDRSPLGTVIMNVSTTPIAGYLLCDGSAFDTALYPDLFALLGSNTTPNLTSQFVRGTNVQGTINGFTQRGDSTARPNAGFTTNSTGAHSHSTTITYYRSNGGNDGNTGPGKNTDTNTTRNWTHTSSSAGAHSHSITGGGDSETAPKHVYLAYHVKSVI